MLKRFIYNDREAPADVTLPDGGRITPEPLSVGFYEAGSVALV